MIKQGNKLGPMQNVYTMLPADILIGPDGSVVRAYYGTDIGDHLSIDEIRAKLAVMSKTRTAAAI